MTFKPNSLTGWSSQQRFMMFTTKKTISIEWIVTWRMIWCTNGTETISLKHKSKNSMNKFSIWPMISEQWSMTKSWWFAQIKSLHTYSRKHSAVFKISKKSSISTKSELKIPISTLIWQRLIIMTLNPLNTKWDNNLSS